MNPYLKNLNKIEFVVTNACTGKCKHCSEGAHELCGEGIDPLVAADAVRRIASVYNINTVMTFGGEPLLYPDTVYEIMNVAKELKIPKRQVITNGFFTRNTEKMRIVAHKLALCGVNDLLLSVNAFHQEYIPLDIVKEFATEVKRLGVSIHLQPAWLVSSENDNPFNGRTREILDSFCDIGIFENDGNVIFPEGNALKYLKDYFTDILPENPYVEDPCDVRCISFSPNGDALGGNIYECDIVEIMGKYTP